MPLSLRRGRVSAIHEQEEELIRLDVDGVPCIAYPRLTGPVALGDDVLVNVQARELALGSGGFDILHANLTRGLGLPVEQGAHVMKLPYTPLQFATVHAEEEGTLELLEGMPVVCCTLHSQLAPVCVALAGLRVAYVQVEGGALPVSLSDTVRLLKTRGLLGTAVAAGACFDGDVDCVNVWSALAWAKANGFDVVVCAVGPGIVGTGSDLGHGGMAAAVAATAAVGVGGKAILALRVSQADARERHRGISHHALDVLGLDGPATYFAWPLGLQPQEVEHGIVESAEVVDVSGWREACEGLPLSHMGRGPDDDPWFFAAAFAAGRLARDLLD
jgi:uncharacterized protein DUF3866